MFPRARGERVDARNPADLRDISLARITLHLTRPARELDDEP